MTPIKMCVCVQLLYVRVCVCVYGQTKSSILLCHPCVHIFVFIHFGAIQWGKKLLKFGFLRVFVEILSSFFIILLSYSLKRN